MGKGLGMHNGIWEQLCGAQAIGDQGGFLERAALHSAPKHSEQRGMVLQARGPSCTRSWGGPSRELSCGDCSRGSVSWHRLVRSRDAIQRKYSQ